MGGKYKRGRLFSVRTGVIGFFLIFQSVLLPQTGFNHDYPRLGIFVWNTHAPASWFAKFDLVVTSSTSLTFAQNLKKLSSDTYLLYTLDINAGQGVSPYNNGWTVHNSSGGDVLIYGGNRPLADLTDFCPLVNGKKYNEAVPGYISTVGDLNVFDGVSSDGMMEYPGTWCTTDIDLDRNGVNDWTEHGEQWLRTQWNNGNTKIFEGYRKLKGEKLFFVNSGGFHNYGWTLTNGMFLEHSWALTSWNYFRGQYMSWMSQARQPHILFLDGTAKFRETGRPARTKNDFQLMRFLLTSCLLGDGYFDFRDVESGEHFYVKWYDEFDLNLGYPTSSPQKLYVEGPGWNEMCVWVRFFDNGVSIINAKGKPQLVSDTDLAKLTGYQGPYYRFQGGQDPDYNNGQLFTSATMAGFYINQTLGQVIGDGLILLKSPLKVVSEVVIDNADAGTSPGSEPAKLTGNWTNQKFGYSYAQVEADWMNIYGQASALAGDGSISAVYQPTIGVAGNYEVFEWHGIFGDLPTQTIEATNVPCAITLGEGRTVNLSINQSGNYGQWNSLGTYSFSKGTNGRIVITNKANGIVLADAFKLVYVGGQLDNTPPLDPTSLKREEATDKLIRISWSTPPAASDGDTVMFCEIYRNNQFVGVSYRPMFEDTKLTESTQYTYKIISYDDSGNQGTNPLTGSFSTIADQTAPKISSVWGKGSVTVEVSFDEPINKTTAETIANYAITGGITVISAKLDDNSGKVVLTTSQHTSGTNYKLTVNNLKDLSVAGNTIAPNTQKEYQASLEPIVITVAADNEYELYVNGTLVGSGNVWSTGARFEVQSVSGKNVIAIKGIDTGGYGGFLAEIEFMGKKYVSNDTWKISTVEQTDWKSVSYNDLGWAKATSYGLHGTAAPWASYQNVTNISTTANVNWIWSSDWENDNTVYLRFTLQTSADTTPPVAPQGVQVKLE